MEMPQLTTARLVLRPFTVADAGDVLAYANDAEWVRYLVNIPHPFSRKDAEAFVERFSDPVEWDDLPMFAIVYEGTVIGEVNLDAIDLANERAELGYQLSRKQWGKGFATEAARAVVDWAFRTYNFHKLYATCDPRNLRSMRVLEKLGMKREGLLTHHLKWHDEYRDVAYYGLLRSEWERQTG